MLHVCSFAQVKRPLVYEGKWGQANGESKVLKTGIHDAVNVVVGGN